MRKVLFLALALAVCAHATIAQANVPRWQPNRYSEIDLGYKQRCSVDQCRATDGGRKFIEYCQMTNGGINNGTVSVLELIGDSGYVCHCPCTLGFEGEVVPNR